MSSFRNIGAAGSGPIASFRRRLGLETDAEPQASQPVAPRQPATPFSEPPVSVQPSYVPDPTPVQATPAEAIQQPPADSGKALTLASLAGLLGLPATASQEEVAAAVDHLVERGQQPAEVPPGVVLVEKGVLEQLRDDAAEVEKARAARRDGIIATALREGRITKPSADELRLALDRDEPGTAALLATFPANAIPVVELGSSLGDEKAEAEPTDYPPGWKR